MRCLTTATALVLLSLVAPSLRTDVARGARQCPTVKISCWDTMTCGELLTFTAKVSDAAADAKLSYNWTVSAGKIASGQGTSSIKVDTTGLAGISVEATVQVTGLPEGCAGKAMCETALICDPLARKFDEYENIHFNDEKARLDSFAIELQNDPTPQGYLICYGGRRGRANEAQSRCDRAKDYLAKVRSINALRIVTVDGGYRGKLIVELWIVPSGATPPTASPTIDPSEARFIKGKPKGRARHH